MNGANMTLEGRAVMRDASHSNFTLACGRLSITGRKYFYLLVVLLGMCLAKNEILYKKISINLQKKSKTLFNLLNTFYIPNFFSKLLVRIFFGRSRV